MVSAEALQLDITPEIRILAVDHFYDAFRATPMMSLRPAVIQAFNFAPDKVTHDLRISRQAATALCRPDVRDLVPDEEAEMPDLSPPGSPCKTPRDVRDPDGDAVMSQGSWSSSDDTSADESCTDEEHDQELFLEAYTSFKTESGDFDSASGLQHWFGGMERLPDSWPMARLAITLDGLVLQVGKVVMTATMEIAASYRSPEDCLPALTQLPKDITIALSLHLADLVASCLSGGCPPVQ